MIFIDFLPLISTIFVFYLGLLVFLKDIKARLNFTFFLLTLSICVWLFGTFMMFINSADRELAIFWDRFVYIGVIFIPVFMYHFNLAYWKRKKNFLLYLSYFLSIFFLLVNQTSYFVDGVFEYKWGIHTKAQLFHHAFLIYFCSYVVIWFYEMLKNYKKLKSFVHKERTKYILLGFLFLFVIGPLAFFPAYGIGVYPFAYTSGVVFTIILSYSILKYKLFNIRIVVTEALTGTFSLLLLFNIFVSTGNIFHYIWKTLLFIIFLIFGGALVRSVFKEIESYEKINNYTKKLKKANSRLRQLDKQKTEFMSFAAHQLKSPLTSVQGFASLITQEKFGKVNKKLKGAAKTIYDASKSMSKSVDDYLKVTRIDQGRMEYEVAGFDLYNLARSVAEELKPTAYKKGLKLKISSDKYRKYPVKADQGKTKQVINNFLDNAIKYTKEGEVKVYVSKQKNDKIRVAISDSGIGMSQKTIKKLFQRYSRAEDTQGISGTGLGLFIAKKMIEAQNGRVWAESPGEGEGSTFCIELPEFKGKKKGG